MISKAFRIAGMIVLASFALSSAAGATSSRQCRRLTARPTHGQVAQSSRSRAICR
jgi:hypothetical protein